MGCAQSSATDAVHAKGAGDKVSKQYGPPQPQQSSVMMSPMASPMSPGGIMLSPGPNGLPPQLSPSPPPLPEDRGMVYISRFAYQARTAEDLSFEKGEKLKVRYIFDDNRLDIML